VLIGFIWLRIGTKRQALVNIVMNEFGVIHGGDVSSPGLLSSDAV
jgi:hypothetical protein